MLEPLQILEHGIVRPCADQGQSRRLASPRPCRRGHFGFHCLERSYRFLLLLIDGFDSSAGGIFGVCSAFSLRPFSGLVM